MGSVCSCFQGDDFGEYANVGASIYRHCICLRCFARQIIQAYSTLFQRGALPSVSPSVQGTTPIASIESSIFDAYRSLPRPLPYDDPRCSRVPRDGLVLRRDKSSGHLNEESEPLRTNSDNEVESPSSKDKSAGSNYDGNLKLCCSGYASKLLPAEFTKGTTYYFPSSEDEDVCPTCLEEYTPENPGL
uniref:RING-type E3 ubiquitin transferase n=1 Tax=Ananas comosus var. bracteatus TaxID=296719 RepID=A0A6V7Q452_ANACO|nr:unnamed protein product [Ananas comosus var. bracteatus]